MGPAAIRPADAGDVPSLLAMMEDFNAVEGIAWDPVAVEPALRRLLADATLGFVLVAAGEGLAGYAVVTFNFDLEFHGRDAFVTELYVRPAARRAGVARDLLAAIEAWAAQEGARALHLLAMPDNGPALALYGAAGFVRSPRVMMTKEI